MRKKRKISVAVVTAEKEAVEDDAKEDE